MSSGVGIVPAGRGGAGRVGGVPQRAVQAATSRRSDSAAGEEAVDRRGAAPLGQRRDRRGQLAHRSGLDERQLRGIRAAGQRERRQQPVDAAQRDPARCATSASGRGTDSTAGARCAHGVPASPAVRLGQRRGERVDHGPRRPPVGGRGQQAAQVGSARRPSGRRAGPRAAARAHAAAAPRASRGRRAPPARRPPQASRRRRPRAPATRSAVPWPSGPRAGPAGCPAPPRTPRARRPRPRAGAPRRRAARRRPRGRRRPPATSRRCP